MIDDDSLRPYFYKNSENKMEIVNLFDPVALKTQLDLKEREEKIIAWLEEHAQFY